MTIASACYRDLRQNRIEANTIASEPLHGWRLNMNHSHVSLEWLLFYFIVNYQLPTLNTHGTRANTTYPIQTTLWTGTMKSQKPCANFKDAFFQGCRKCYPNRSEPHRRLEDRSMEDVYICTQRKVADLESRGYTVKKMWESQ